MVCVGPPLFCRGPSMGSVLFRSPIFVKLQVASPLRLKPFEVIMPMQFPPALFATILFWRVVDPAFEMPPPELAELLLMVLLLIVCPGNGA